VPFDKKVPKKEAKKYWDRKICWWKYTACRM
jgi:hypothetical protein